MSRAVALKLSGEEEDEGASTMLLEDIESLFRESEVDVLFSEDIVEHLVEMEERPWPEWSKGKPITKQKVASLLKPFGIRPKPVWKPGDGTKRGYMREAFDEAFSRYLSVRSVRTQVAQQVTGKTDGTKLAYSRGGLVSNLWRVPIFSDRPAKWEDAEQLTFDEACVTA